MCFFSVVIPLYNKADTIVRALRSVLVQTCRDYEVVVVDDGSTDLSAAIVKDFIASDEWRLAGVEGRLISQKNSGASSARNTGANAAKGRFVTMLDGDDEWLPNHLADLKKVFDFYPKARVMTTNTISVYHGVPKPSRCKNTGIGTINVFDYPEGGYPISSDTITVERELFLSLGGYDTQYSYFEDREFYYRLCDAVGDFYVNWSVSAYYHHDAVCSANKGRRRGYGEYGYLCLAEKRMRQGEISPRMKCCAVRSVNNIIRGNVVRFKFGSVTEMCQAVPLLSKEIFIVRQFNHIPSRLMIWSVYFFEWIWARGRERLIRLTSWK